MSELSPHAAADLTAAQLGQAYRSGATDPVAVTEACLSRIEAAADASVFITVTAARARKEAAASQKRWKSGAPLSPLDGVPVAWKDLFDMEGVVTTAGSALLMNADPAEADAPVVSNLAASGMVSLGKVNLTEFAFSGIGLNPHFGTCANPYDDKVARVPGGSSSGSAVAVAAGLSPVAIGSDTGGSVRIPAAFNGLVGYKSSFGRISKDGVYPLSETFDTVGPLCRSVEDAILVDGALRRERSRILPADISSIRFIVCESVVLDGLDEWVAKAMDEAIGRIEAAGGQVERRPIPEVETAFRTTGQHGTLVAAEAYYIHRERVDGPDVQMMDGRVVARILLGKSMSAHDVVSIHAARNRAMASLPGTLGGAFVLSPTVPHIAPEIEPLDADPEVFSAWNLKTLRNTAIGNFLDMPGVAIPIPGAWPMPVSLQVAGPRGSDPALLSTAWAVEAALSLER